MPLPPNFTSSFVVSEDQERIVRRNKERIERQFRVRLDFPSDGVGSGSERKERWINVSAAASPEVCSKVTEFVIALCSPEVVSTHQCAVSTYRELLVSDLKERLECDYAVVMELLDVDRCIVRVHGSELSVALALSAIDDLSLVGGGGGAPVAEDTAAGWCDPPSQWEDRLPAIDPPTAHRSAASSRPPPVGETAGLANTAAGLSQSDIGRAAAEADDSVDMKILPRSLYKPLRSQSTNHRSARREAVEPAAGAGRARLPSTDDMDSDVGALPPSPPPPASEHVSDNTSELAEAARLAGFDDLDIGVLLSQSERGVPSYRSAQEFIGALEKARQQKTEEAFAQPPLSSARTTSLTEAARLLPTGLGPASAPLAGPWEHGGGSGGTSSWEKAAVKGAGAAATDKPSWQSVVGGASAPRPGQGGLDARVTPGSLPISGRDRVQTTTGTFPPTRSPGGVPPSVWLDSYSNATATDLYGAGGSRTRPPLPGLDQHGLLGPRLQLPLGGLGPDLRPRQQGAAAQRWMLDLNKFPDDAAPKPAAPVAGSLGSEPAGSSLYPVPQPTTLQASGWPKLQSAPSLTFLATSSNNSASTTGVADFAKTQGYSDAEIELVSSSLGSDARHADFMSALKVVRAQGAAADKKGAVAAASSRPIEPQQKPAQTQSTAAPLQGGVTIPLPLGVQPAYLRDPSALGQRKGSGSEPSSAVYSDKQLPVSDPADSQLLQQQLPKPRGGTPVTLVQPTSKSKDRGLEQPAAQPPAAAGAVRQGKSGNTSGSSSSSKKSLDIYDFAKMLGYTHDDITAALAEIGQEASRDQLMAALKRQQQLRDAAGGKQPENQPPVAGGPSAAKELGSGWQRLPTAALRPPKLAAGGPAASFTGQPGSRRHVVIDGSNVAMYQGDGIFRCRYLKMCVDYFREKGHTDITVVVPLHRKTDPATRDAHILDELHSKKILVYQPSKKLPNMPSIRPYDDKLILDIATKYDGVVISNDNYKDLLDDSRERDYIIKNRVIMFTIIADDMFYINDDPMGRHGPSLDDLLTRR